MKERSARSKISSRSERGFRFEPALWNRFAVTQSAIRKMSGQMQILLRFDSGEAGENEILRVDLEGRGTMFPAGAGPGFPHVLGGEREQRCITFARK